VSLSTYNLKVNINLKDSQTLYVWVTAGTTTAATNQFTVSTTCIPLTPYAFSGTYSYVVPATATGQEKIGDLLGAQPSQSSACSLTMSLVDASNNPVTQGFLTLVTTTYPYEIKVNRDQANDQTVKIKYTYAGVESYSAQFRVVSSCQALTWSTLNAVGSPYEYTIPTLYSSNQVVVALLNAATSQLSACPIVFTMKDSSGTTITPADITIAASYPYNLQVNINKKVDQQMYIAATVNGVAQTSTNQFIVRTLC